MSIGAETSTIIGETIIEGRQPSRSPTARSRNGPAIGLPAAGQSRPMFCSQVSSRTRPRSLERRSGMKFESRSGIAILLATGLRQSRSRPLTSASSSPGRCRADCPSSGGLSEATYGAAPSIPPEAPVTTRTAPGNRSDPSSMAFRTRRRPDRGHDPAATDGDDRQSRLPPAQCVSLPVAPGTQSRAVGDQVGRLRLRPHILLRRVVRHRLCFGVKGQVGVG